MVQGDGERTPVYQKIEMVHDALVFKHLETGHDMKDDANPFKKSLLDVVWVPSTKLMARIDPKRNRSYECVRKEVQQHAIVYSTYQKQACTAREEVESWIIEKYLDVMVSFVVVNHIQHPDEPLGEFLF